MLGLAAPLGPDAGRGRLILQRVAMLFRVAAKPKAPAATDRFPAVKVGDPRLQDSVKQRSPFLLRAARIVLHQLQHRFLYDVQGVFPVPRAELCDTQGTSLDAGKKTIQGLCVQCVRLPRPAGNAPGTALEAAPGALVCL